MQHRDYWYISSVSIFILATIICGAMVLHAFYGTFIGFGYLLANLFIVFGVYGMSTAGAIGALLGFISYFKRDRKRKALIVMALNIALAMIPATVFNYYIIQKENQRQAAIEAQTPTERLFGIARTSNMYQRRKEIIHFLELGADINALNPDKNMTVLIYVIAYQHKPEAIDFMIKHGAEVNLQTSEGWTALHSATSAGKVSMVKTLLEHGADRSLLTNKNETALDIAQQRLKIYMNKLNAEYQRQPYLDIISLLQPAPENQ